MKDDEHQTIVSVEGWPTVVTFCCIMVCATAIIIAMIVT